MSLVTDHAFDEPAVFIAVLEAQSAILPQTPTLDPHLGLPWFRLLAATAMPPGARLALCRASKQEAPAAFLPLLVMPDSPHRILALGNFYTPLFGIVGEEHADPATLQALARQLKTGKPGCDELRLAPMDPLSSSYKLLGESFRNAGWLVDDYFCFGNWYETIAERDAQTYLTARPSRLRHTLQRAEKRLAKTPGYELKIFKETGPELDEAIEAFVTVYNRSWKTPEPYPEFIPGLCRLAAENGWLRLGLLQLDHKPLAAQIWLVVGKQAFIVKLAYDQDFSYLSPGTVLTAALFRQVIDVDRVNLVDYLIGDDPYKQEWMTQRRERRGIVAFNPRRWSGLFAALRHSVGKLRRR